MTDPMLTGFPTGIIACGSNNNLL